MVKLQNTNNGKWLNSRTLIMANAGEDAVDIPNGTAVLETAMEVSYKN